VATAVAVLAEEFEDVKVVEFSAHHRAAIGRDIDEMMDFAVQAPRLGDVDPAPLTSSLISTPDAVAALLPIGTTEEGPVEPLSK